MNITLVAIACLILSSNSFAAAPASFSEATACQMATASIQAVFSKDHFNRLEKVNPCISFESDVSRGVARIVVPIRTRTVVSEGATAVRDWNYIVNFYHTDQGWKVRSEE